MRVGSAGCSARHGYVDVDDDIVVSSFADVAQLHRFVREVSAWLLDR